MDLRLLFYIFISTISVVVFAKVSEFTKEEKAAISKLRNEVASKLTIHYQTSDAYLIKWLKAKKFDHAKAKEALEKTLEWRKEINADNLPFEDYGDLTQKYVLDYKSTRDKEGGPVVLVPFGDWDIRRKALEGKLSELTRRLDYMEENIAQLGFNRTGDPIGMAIADFTGISVRQHACVRCVQFFISWVRHHELYYPYNFYRVAVINTPGFFEPVLRIIRPLMTESTNLAFRSLGYDRDEWAELIHQTVSPDQLPYRFGGNKKKSTQSQLN